LQHYPADSRNLLVLAHGAGAGERHPFMTAMGRGLAERGIDVVTFEFPYMREKRRVPDKAPVLEAAFRDAVAEALDRRGGSPQQTHLFIGGKSMGGRMATHLAAQGLEALRGVVALGYPLHPPGKPEQLRVAHLPSIRVPVLIVQGERDAFGTPAELRPVVDTIPSAVTLHVVAGGDHSLAVPKSAGVSQKEIYANVLDAIAAWIQST
jgi:predicted alpha/beta-hydrolase family hydrolase